MTSSMLELPTVTETGLVPRALAVKIKDADTNTAAAELLKELAAERKEIVSQTEDVIKKAHDLHKKLKGDQNALIEPIEEAERYLRGELGRYESEQVWKRIEADKIAAEERRKVEESARLEAAAEAEKNGSAALVEAILEERFTPIEVTFAVAATPAPTYAPKPRGVAFTTVYDIDVTDKIAFVRWVASKPEFIQLLNVDEQALKRFASSTQGTMQPAGIKITSRQVAKTTGR